MIPDEQAEAAVDWLRDNADAAAKAKAERLYLEQWIKTVRAQETLASEAKTASEREAEGQASTRFQEAIVAYKAAVEADERHRFMREAAAAKIEAWRTLNANLRGMGK